MQPISALKLILLYMDGLDTVRTVPAKVKNWYLMSIYNVKEKGFES